MAIEGRSAGGLLIGAVLNMAPEICRIAFAGVPFVDVINTMMDASIPLTVNEYEEWGNPNEVVGFNFLDLWYHFLTRLFVCRITLTTCSRIRRTTTLRRV
jgi:prolyl oligopeptidase PreP (S9A serine peptidase family)